jgi:hypothetical protein
MTAPAKSQATMNPPQRHPAPHLTVPRAASDFVTGSLGDRRLGRLTPTACLVVGELVTNAMTHTGTDIELSVAVHHDALRLTVRDRCPTPRRRQAASPGAHVTAGPS